MDSESERALLPGMMLGLPAISSSVMLAGRWLFRAGRCGSDCGLAFCGLLVMGRGNGPWGGVDICWSMEDVRSGAVTGSELLRVTGMSGSSIWGSMICGIGCEY